MKYFYLLVLLLLLTLETSAQASSNSSPLSVLEKNWQMTWRTNSSNSNNSGLSKDPFQANEDAKQSNKDQRDYLREREIRARSGQPVISPPVRKNKIENETRNGVITTYLYQTKVQNNGAKTIQKVVWEYVFFDKNTAQEVGRHEFTSEETVKPNKTGNLVGKLFSSPTGTYNVKDAGKKASDLYNEQINIKIIYYTDGSVWQSDSK